MPTEPHDATADDAHRPDPGPPRWDPAAERDTRRQAREASRGSRTARPEAAPKRGRRRPFARSLTSVAIVAVVVAVAVLVGSQTSAAWVVGLVCAIVTLGLVAVLPHQTPDRRRRG